MSKDYQIVRYYTSGKNTFEILTKPGTARSYRNGKIGFSKVMFSDEIYLNHTKGDKPRHNDLLSVFGTSVIEDCVKIILEKGDISLSTAERREMINKKKREIINFVHKYYTDSRTKTMIPVTRIESAMDSIKLKIDLNRSAEEHVNSTIERQLKDILPMKKTVITGKLFIPHTYLGKSQAIISKWSTLERETYNGKGCIMHVSFVPGVFDSFLDELRQATDGNHTFDTDFGSGTTTKHLNPKKKQNKPKIKGRKLRVAATAR